MGRLLVGAIALGLLIKLLPLIIAAVVIRAVYLVVRTWHRARQQALRQAESERLRQAAKAEAELLRALTPADRAWLAAHARLATEARTW
jgi:hypothetical protein